MKSIGLLLPQPRPVSSQTSTPITEGRRGHAVHAVRLAQRRGGGAVDAPHLGGVGALSPVHLRGRLDRARDARPGGRHAGRERARARGEHPLIRGPAHEETNGTGGRHPPPAGAAWIGTGRVRAQPEAALRASPRSLASSADISTTRRPPPSRGTRITMPRPSLVTSRGPSPVRGF